MKIKVIKAEKVFVFQGKTNLSLLEQLREEKIYVAAVCGGTGRCGKCKVQMLAGTAEPSEMERMFFTDEELAKGFRLACKTFPRADCTILIEDYEETQFQAITECLRRKSLPVEGKSQKIYNRQVNEQVVEQIEHKRLSQEEKYRNVSEEYVIGIDLGTTTVAMKLVEKNHVQTIHTVTFINRQRSYGADVIARIQAANEGKGTELKACMVADLYQGIKKLITEGKVNPKQIREIGIAGNTTMGHLFMGYSCENLGQYPFKPVNIKTIIREFQEVFAEQQRKDSIGKLEIDANVILLPGISTYVGADILAGILASRIDEQKKPCMLIDLGTNGEMVIGNREKILTASVAAGPAFEGGNISCGMGSVPGAISKVFLQGDEIALETIGKQAPLGLCGSGVLELIFELLKENIVDETGMFAEAFIEEGFLLGTAPDGKKILFTQKDVREIQMAKSAVRAGIETLLKHYGITYEEMGEVFLAGGFGYQTNIEKAIAIGMFPKEFQGKITIMGNSALGGTIAYLTEADAVQRCEKITEKTQEVELSLDTDFNEFYIKYMFF